MKTATNPGYKTSELWVLIISGAVSIATTAGWLTSSQASGLTMQTPAIISDVGTMLAAVVYILSRSGLKWRWLTLAAADLATPAPDPTQPLPDSPPSPSYGAPVPASPNGTAPTPVSTASSI